MSGPSHPHAPSPCAQPTPRAGAAEPPLCATILQDIHLSATSPTPHCLAEAQGQKSLFFTFESPGDGIQ